MMGIPEAARRALITRLEERQQERWPDLGDLTVRFQEDFVYVEGLLPAGDRQRLFRLRYLGVPTFWRFAIFTASKGDYEDIMLPSDSLIGTPEEALDCACGLYLQNITASQLRTRGSRVSQEEESADGSELAPLFLLVALGFAAYRILRSNLFRRLWNSLLETEVVVDGVRTSLASAVLSDSGLQSAFVAGVKDVDPSAWTDSEVDESVLATQLATALKERFQREGLGA